MRPKLILITAFVFAFTFRAEAQLISHHGVVKGGYDFWVYVPQDRAAKDTTKLPLVLFLHGKSLSGTNLEKVREYEREYDR